MSRFLDSRLASLKEYVPGEQPQERKYVKLNTNESPSPPSPAVLRAVSEAETARLNLYPDPECRALKSRLAEYYGVLPENVFVANGSDDILNFAFMGFCGEKRPVVFPDVSYGFYEVYADLYGIPFKKIPLNADLTLDPADYMNVKANVVLANPNAPTGLAVGAAAIGEIARTNPDFVVLADEAYVDFGGETALPLVAEYENLLVVRTYSKSRSMAGARLGFAIGQPSLIADLEKLKFSTNPYSINRLSLVAAEAALEDGEYYTENCKKIAETRDFTRRELLKRGFEVTDSKANFLFARLPGVPGGELYSSLRERGVLVRHFTAARIDDYLRITIGTPEQMQALLKALDRG